MPRLHTVLAAAVLLTSALPAHADFDFVGYGLSLELSPLIGPDDASRALPHHNKPYLNDRLMWLRQVDPIGIVVDAQFFGLAGAIYGISCAVEGTPCPQAEQTYNGGGYHRYASLDVALTLDYDNVHPGFGLTLDLAGAPTIAGIREDVLGVGVDYITGLSGLGPIYLQAGVGAQPAFRSRGFSFVGVRAAGEVTAVVAIPWIALYGTAGYQSLIPTDAAFELSHGPYVQIGLMVSIGTIFDTLGLGWRAAEGVGKVIGGDKKRRR